ncbi:lysophospholipid acyltransferase family protein [Roseospirillum parvum]|uniref:1-acyl-sn-glycerol-3-phosphate acyltransferase n=1 Tax=Roseospirillum parvum TaxID=83401 RepID=A0A1G8CTC1_9PROT|nr:lysophospholipid acyltransferase family protein [Roseospirillum parvum]SDH48523.1 1-acyl-sn-glycerol-3-phosphate acyltransferase [Roseospirillum parvum]
MTALRSFVYLAAQWAWTLVLATLYIPGLLLPTRWFLPFMRFWMAGMRRMARYILGITWEVRGLENVPPGPAIIASRHQSAFDTFLFHALLDFPVYIFKKELVWIPFVGFYMLRAGMIPIDRKGGASAMKTMLRHSEKALERDAQVVIFPEGTRTPPGERKPYHPGVVALAARFPEVPVIPVALNTGHVWKREAWIKKPGHVVIEFLPPMPPVGKGLDRRAYLTELQDRIEATGAKLPGPREAPHG